MGLLNIRAFLSTPSCPHENTNVAGTKDEIDDLHAHLQSSCPCPKDSHEDKRYAYDEKGGDRILWFTSLCIFSMVYWFNYDYLHSLPHHSMASNVYNVIKPDASKSSVYAMIISDCVVLVVKTHA